MSMKHYTAALGGALFLAACGGGSIIDNAKKSYMAECPGHSLGSLVNGYFITGFDSTTNWLAYATDDPETVRITASGDVQYLGIQTVAELELLYTEATQTLVFTGLKLNDVEQTSSFAADVVSIMCDEAKGL